MATSGLNRFICGMSRGGTTAMMRCLNGHPDCAAYGETAFWTWLWKEPGADGSYDRAQIDRIAASLDRNRLGPIGSPGGLNFDEGVEIGACAAQSVRELEAGATPGETFQAMGEAIAAHEGKRYWIEKTPKNLLHLDRINRYLGETRFVVMLRKPADFMLSYKHQGDRLKPEARKRFHRLYHPASASWICRRYLAAAAQAREERAGQALIVFLEDVVKEPDIQLRRVTDHLEIDPFPPGYNFAKDNSSFTKKEKPELAPEERMWLNLFAGKVAKKIGSPIDKPPFAPLRFAGSVALLPWAAVRCLTVLPHIFRTTS